MCIEGQLPTFLRGHNCKDIYCNKRIHLLVKEMGKADKRGYIRANVEDIPEVNIRKQKLGLKNQQQTIRYLLLLTENTLQEV